MPNLSIRKVYETCVTRLPTARSEERVEWIDSLLGHGRLTQYARGPN